MIHTVIWKASRVNRMIHTLIVWKNCRKSMYLSLIHIFLPERFSVCAGVLRTEERAKEVAHKEGVFATSDLDQALERKPDFAVLCVPRDVTKDYLVKLMKKGIPVLCETPPGKNVEELKELWEMSQKYNGRIQIVEQYFLQPYYAGILDIIKQGYLGNVSSIMLAALQDVYKRQ